MRDFLFGWYDFVWLRRAWRAKRLLLIALLGLAAVLSYTAIVGGTLYETLDGSTVFSWFAIATLIPAVLLLLYVIICFLFWLFPPVVTVTVLAVGVLFLVVFLFFSLIPGMPVTDLTETFKSMLGFLNK